MSLYPVIQSLGRHNKQKKKYSLSEHPDFKSSVRCGAKIWIGQNETLSSLNVPLFSNKLFKNSKEKWSEEWKRFRVMQGLHSGSFYQKLCAMRWFSISNPGQKQGCLINLGLALTNNQARGKFQKSGKNTLLRIVLLQTIRYVLPLGKSIPSQKLKHEDQPWKLKWKQSRREKIQKW